LTEVKGKKTHRCHPERSEESPSDRSDSYRMLKREHTTAKHLVVASRYDTYNKLWFLSKDTSLYLRDTFFYLKDASLYHGDTFIYLKDTSFYLGDTSFYLGDTFFYL